MSVVWPLLRAKTASSTHEGRLICVGQRDGIPWRLSVPRLHEIAILRVLAANAATKGQFGLPLTAGPGFLVFWRNSLYLCILSMSKTTFTGVDPVSERCILSAFKRRLIQLKA